MRYAQPCPLHEFVDLPRQLPWKLQQAQPLLSVPIPTQLLPSGLPSSRLLPQPFRFQQVVAAMSFTRPADPKEYEQHAAMWWVLPAS